MHVHPKREKTLLGVPINASIAAASGVAKVTYEMLYWLPTMRSTLAITWQNAKDMLLLVTLKLLVK